MIQYKIQLNSMTGQPCAVTVVGQNISIPMSENNTDYQEYLKWLAEGNEVLPADSQE